MSSDEASATPAAAAAGPSAARLDAGTSAITKSTLGRRSTRHSTGTIAQVKPKYEEEDSDADLFESYIDYRGRKKRGRKYFDANGNRLPPLRKKASKKAKSKVIAAKKLALAKSTVVQGALESLWTLPMDIISEILAQLSIVDLTQLTRVSIDLRHHLLSRNTGMPIWTHAFERLYALGLPECPEELDLPRYAEILSLKDCVCGKRLTDWKNDCSVSFAFGLRFCKACWRQYMAFADIRNPHKILSAEVALIDEHTTATQLDDLDPRVMALATSCEMVYPSRRWYGDPGSLKVVYLPELEQISTEIVELEEGAELEHFTRRLAQKEAREAIALALDIPFTKWARDAEQYQLPAQKAESIIRKKRVGISEDESADDSEDSDIMTQTRKYKYGARIEQLDLRDLDWIRPPRAAAKQVKAEVDEQLIKSNKDKLRMYLLRLEDEMDPGNVDYLKLFGHIESAVRSTDAEIDDEFCEKQLPALRKVLEERDATIKRQERTQRIHKRCSQLRMMHHEAMEELYMNSEGELGNESPPLYDLLRTKPFRRYVLAEPKEDGAEDNMADAADDEDRRTAAEKQDEAMLKEIKDELVSIMETADATVKAEFLSALRDCGYGRDADDDLVLQSAPALWQCKMCDNLLSFDRALSHDCTNHYHTPEYKTNSFAALPTKKGPQSRGVAPIDRELRDRIITALEAAGVSAATSAADVVKLGKAFFIAPAAKLKVPCQDQSFLEILNSLHDFESLVNALTPHGFDFAHAVRKVADEDDEDAIEMACCVSCSKLRPAPIKEARYHVGATHGVILRNDQKCVELEVFKAKPSSLDLAKHERTIAAPHDYLKTTWRYRYGRGRDHKLFVLSDEDSVGKGKLKVYRESDSESD